jgi:hypothetical protein
MERQIRYLTAAEIHGICLGGNEIVDALELARRCSKELELSTENSNMYTMRAARAFEPCVASGE